jgi:NADH-quinone oxidoreductase subunit E
MGTACHIRGGKFLSDAVGWKLGIGIGQTTSDKRFEFQRGTCLGCCTLGPVVKVNENVHSRMLVTELKKILEQDE